MEDFFFIKLFGGSVTIMQLGHVLLALAAGFVAHALVKVTLDAIVRRTDKESIRGAVIVALDGPLRWAVLVAALWIGYVVLTSRAGTELGDALMVEHAGQAFLVSELPFFVWFGLRLIDGITGLWAERAKLTEGTFDDQLVPIVRSLGKVTLLIVGTLLIVQNLGGEVGSLLAGFGIGGAAVALASKDTIANLFGSIVVFIDRPFQVGDWVEIGQHEGTIEEVGLRVTRIRTFANSLITVPNSSLTTTAINNWSRMRKRRIKLTIGVTYGSTPEQLQAGVAAIREVLKGDKRISQDFMLVNFTDFGASSLDIFIYAFTVTTRWDEYMQVREELLLEFMRRFRDLGLSFAFPSQSVYVESLPPGTPKAMERQLPM
ncbi:MAG: mechanosensitive ion channel family protein [Enhygromyxa sp.]